MSLDYRLKEKNQTDKLTYEKLQSLVATEFEITANKAGPDGQLVSFSLELKGGKENLDFELLEDGGYMINIYNYDKETYQRVLRNIARLAQLLNSSILDVQTQATIENPDPETIVTPERLEILEAQLGTVKNLPNILEQAERWRKDNKPLK